MWCPNCGKVIDDNDTFCGYCGKSVKVTRKTEQEEKTSQSPVSSTRTQSNAKKENEEYRPNQQSWQEFSVDRIPEEYKPITMWGYFGYQILFSIPIVGIILLLVFAFGGTKNINLKNFARSYFCFLIIVAIVVAIASTTILAGASSYYF